MALPGHMGWIGRAALAIGVAPGVAVAGEPGMAAPSAWPFLVAALLCVSAFGAGLVLSGDGAAWWRGRSLRRHVGALELPGAITGTDGRIGWANPAMRLLLGGAGPGRAIGEALALDEGLVYRLAVRARKLGFALQPVEGPPRSDRERKPCILTARYDDPGRLVWTLLPPDEIDTSVHAGASAVADEVVAVPDHAGAGRQSGAPDAMAAFDSVPVALLQVDTAGRIRIANRAARDLLGTDPEAGTALGDLMEPLGRPMEALIEDAGASPAGQREMVRLLEDGGTEGFLQVSLTPATLDGESSLLAMLTDASELRQLEDKFAQSQKMEAVGKLAGGVAHDFNNVLTAISGHSDLLLLGKDALHPDYSDLMQIRQNTHRAAALVRQLLAFSRKQTLNPAILSVRDVVADTRYLLDRLIGEKVTLVMEHGRDLGQVKADHQQLEQALMNLVVNARDAMPEGGTITIATRNQHVDGGQRNRGVDIRPGDYVEITVADEGPGIEPGLVDRVFDPFFTTKPVGEGTGLGLSTVYGIVKQSAGYIFAENRSQGGAQFRILLPQARAAAEPVQPSLAAPDTDARASLGDLTGTGTIMLVEDEDPVRAFATRALKLRGYEVIAAGSAEEAMVLLEERGAEVDLLVSDVVMPGMDGPTFAAEARRLRPGLSVIFVSGYAEDSFRKNLKDSDFAFLPKPFTLTELTSKVKEALKARA